MHRCLVVVLSTHKYVPEDKKNIIFHEFNERYAKRNYLLPEVFHVLIQKILVRPPLLVNKLSTLSLKSRHSALDVVILPKINKKNSMNSSSINLIVQFYGKTESK